MLYNLIYIDDNIDFGLNKYLKENADILNYKYKEREFKTSETYEDLLNDTLIQQANIIIIDSRLFEDSRVINGKFTGQEFKLLLNKTLPFIEVLLISQNIDNNELGFIKKFDNRNGNTDENVFYDRKLKNEITEAIERLNKVHRIYDQLKKNEAIDKYLVEKIESSLSGEIGFDNLKKEDIDEIIKVFNELRSN